MGYMLQFLHTIPIFIYLAELRHIPALMGLASDCRGDLILDYTMSVRMVHRKNAATYTFQVGTRALILMILQGTLAGLNHPVSFDEWVIKTL